MIFYMLYSTYIYCGFPLIAATGFQEGQHKDSHKRSSSDSTLKRCSGNVNLANRDGSFAEEVLKVEIAVLNKED